MKFFKLLPLLVLSLVFAGCTGYQLGSTLPQSIQSVSLTVENNSPEPSIEVAVMKALRAEVQQDGRLALRSPGESDVVLDVELTGYRLAGLSYDRIRGALTREYRVVMNAKAVLYDSETGEVLREIPSVSGDTDFPYDADLTAGKRSALNDAAADLARKIVAQTIAAW